MNISKWAYEGTPNYPVRVTQKDDGLFYVTTQAIKDKEWTGESVDQAMRSFSKSMDEEYDRLMENTQPEWMKAVKDGTW
jgi:hypothetical protein